MSLCSCILTCKTYKKTLVLGEVLMKCIFRSAADRSAPNACVCHQSSGFVCLILCCGRDTTSLWYPSLAMDRRYCQGETDFSSDTVRGLIVPPEQISVGSYTVHNQASCLPALAISSLPSRSSALHLCCSASVYSAFQCGVV